MTEPVDARSPADVQINFGAILTGARNYQDIQVAIKKAIDGKKQRGIDKVGFVSGGIRDGVEAKLDRDKMRETTSQLREQYGTPIFASTDIFDTVWTDLDETPLMKKDRDSHMLALFRGILGSGVTDIYMLDGWQNASGAVDEHKAAQNLGITIHYLGQKT